HALFDDERSARLDLSGEPGEGAAQLFVRAVDVEVVGVRGGDDRRIGPQVEERAVELVGFYGKPVAGPVDEVAVEVFRYAAQERASASSGHMVQPCGEGGGGGLA